MKPKKILMTADTLGGVWIYALSLSRELEEAGVTVYLATMGKRLSPAQEAMADELPNLRVIQSEYKLEWMNDPWEDVRQAGEWLLELEQDIEPDLIHLNGYAHAALAWKSPVVVVAHSDVFSWFDHVKASTPGPHWDTYHQKVEKGLQKADHLVAVSRSVADDLRKHYSFNTDLEVVYNGLRPGEFTVGQKSPCVLSIGRIWDEAKNFSLLDEAAALHKMQVCLVGEAKHPEYGSSPDLPHLKLTGKLERQEVINSLSEASVYCHPALYEPFGYTPLEAAFSGCALLLSDIPTMHELWGDAALYFDPQDAGDLCKKMQRLQRDEALQRKLSVNAMQKASSYTARKMADKYLNLYSEIIENKTQKANLSYEN